MPLLPEIGLLAMPYHHFNSIWMPPHHVLTRLAGYFHVTWLEPPHHWRDARGARNSDAATEELTRCFPPSFPVYVPEPWLPEIYRFPRLRRLLLRARVKRGLRQLASSGCRKLVLYLWHPQYERAIGVGLQDLSLYHIDDEYSFAPDPPPLDATELRLIREVDNVFVHSPQLMERKGWINPNTTFMPNGVDYRLYSTPVAEPNDIKNIPHPRIGYTGNIKTQLDWQLLKELAIRHGDWSFVFVGPRLFLTTQDRALLDEMARLKNVHLLGGKTVKGLAAYPQHFDVCIMPYVINGYTQNIYPLKLHEYLASGRPVVGSPIRTLKDFSQVIALPTTVDEWSNALSHSLLNSALAAEVVAARQALARQHDWNEIAFRIANIICERINPGLEARLELVPFDTPDISFWL